MTSCKKCNSNCKSSKALLNTIVTFDDFSDDAGKRGSTQSRVGVPEMVDCMKCENCGHSFVLSKEEQLKELLRISIENGWKDKKGILEAFTNDVKIMSNNCSVSFHKYNYILSLNDLISNSEKGEVSFIDALCKALTERYEFDTFEPYRLIKGNGKEIWINKPEDLDYDVISGYWVNLYSNERFDFLLNIFKCLL